MKKAIFNWIEEISRNQRLPQNIAALNFGLIESNEGLQVYLTGSFEYDEEDDDWACNEDYIADPKYLNLFVNNTDWQKNLDLICGYIEEFLNSEYYHNSILRNAPNITVGFDDGELNKITLPNMYCVKKQAKF